MRKRSVAQLVLLSAIALVLALSVFAAPIPFESTQMPTNDDSQDDKTCEVHGIFAYAEPSEANILSPDVLLTLSSYQGKSSGGVVAIIDEFLSRVKDGEIVYVTTYASIEGQSSYNKDLSKRRARGIRNLIEDRLKKEKFQGKNIRVATDGRGETDYFWPLNTADKKLLSTYNAGATEYQDTPQLIANRRFILSTYSMPWTGIKIREPYKFYSDGCPDNEPPEIVTPPDGFQQEVAPGEDGAITVEAKDPDLDKPGSVEKLTFSLSDNPAGMNIKKTSDKSAEIKMKIGKDEGAQSQSFTVTVTDRSGESDKATYSYMIVVPDKPENKTPVVPPPVEGGTWPWYLYLLPLLLLLIMPWAFKRRALRRESVHNAKLKMEQLTTWEQIIVFLKEVKKRKKVIAEKIEKINISVAKLEPGLKARLAEKVRDIAYLYDPKSQEVKNLDAEGKIINDILQDYLHLWTLMFELYSDELALDHIFMMIETKKIRLSSVQIEEELLAAVKEAKTIVAHVETECESIFTYIENYTREGGLVISGVASFTKGNIQHIMEKGVKHWWQSEGKIEHLHDTTVLRSMKYFGPDGGAKRVMSGTRAFEPAMGYQAPRGLKTLLEKDIWPHANDRLKGVSVLKTVGEKLVTQIQQEEHVYKELESNIGLQLQRIDELIRIIGKAPKGMSVHITEPKDGSKIQQDWLQKGEIKAEIRGGVPDYMYNLMWGNPKEGKVAPLSPGMAMIPLGDETHIVFKMENNQPMDPKHYFNDKFKVNGHYQIFIRARDGTGIDSNETSRITLITGGGVPGPCADERDRLEKKLKGVLDRGTNLERNSIIAICGDRVRGKLASGNLTEMNNWLYNKQILKDWKAFKPFIKDVASVAKLVDKAIEKYNPKLAEQFVDGKAFVELDRAATRYGRGAFQSNKVFQENIDNTKDGEARIKRLYGALEKLNVTDKQYDQGLELLRKKTPGSYNRYTFKFYPAILNIAEKMIKILEGLCEEEKGGKVIPLPPVKPTKTLNAGPEIETDKVDLPQDLISILDLREMKSIDRISWNLRYIIQIPIDRDLKRALGRIKREIAKAKSNIFGPEYRQVIREDPLKGNIYRPFSIEKCIFGDAFVRQKDKLKIPSPPGIGQKNFVKEVFLKLNYENGQSGMKSGTIRKIYEFASAVRVVVVASIGDCKRNVRKLHEESKKVPDKRSIELIDEMVRVMEDERTRLEHILQQLEQITAHAKEVNELNSDEVKEFMQGLEDLAKSTHDWGGGDWGEDDNNVDNVVNTPGLNFEGIPDLLELLLEELKKQCEDTQHVYVETQAHIRRVNGLWERHVIEILEKMPSREYKKAA